MNEVVVSEVVLEDQEKAFSGEVMSIEDTVGALQIRNDSDYEKASEILTSVKKTQKRIKDFFDPIVSAAYQSHKTATERRKAMLDPVIQMEKTLKEKMGKYDKEKEDRIREQEENLRRLAREEAEKKLAEAIEAEKNGDSTAYEYIMAEAEVMDNMSNFVVVPRDEKKVAGISKKKSFKITDIDYETIPDDFLGKLIKTACSKVTVQKIVSDLILKVIKDSNGRTSIPGVRFEETVDISVRAS